MQYPQKDLYNDEMDWKEFATLLNGIMPETPLGKIIAIRSESDEDVLKHFSPEQRRIREEWSRKRLQERIKQMNKQEVMKQMKEMFRSMAT